MEVKSLITREGNYKVEIKEKYVFDEKQNLNKYKELFEALKRAGNVKAHSFSDLVWYFPCPTTFKDIDFHFGVEIISSFRNSLKAYVLLRRKSGIKPRTIKNDLRFLKDVISSTNGLQDEKSVREYFLTPRADIYEICYTLARYLNFNRIRNLRETVIDIMEGLQPREIKSRDLPPFNDVLILDECINRYFTEHSMDETLKWYPVKIWWDLTNKLPMRPIDLITTIFNCLDRKKDGSFWITIPRHKLQTTELNESSKSESLQIDETTYQMIREFQIRLEILGVESEFLFPQLDKINPRLREPWTLNKEMASSHQFRNLLTFFYEEIVEEQYGEFSLDRVTPGDTRHFAIMNLFLQGFNILTISRMAGHEEITSPANYYSHAKHYATSAVYKLAQRKIEGDIGSTMSDGFFGWRDNQVRRAKHNLVDEKKIKEKKWRKVDFGYCRDVEGFPDNCVEDCRLCQKYYEFKPSVNEWKNGLEWFESYSNNLEIEINNTLDLMAALSTKTYSNLKGLEALDEKECKSLSIELFKYLDHKAIIDAKILEEKLKEREVNEGE